MNSREERLKKLQEAKEKLSSRASLPTVKKEELQLSGISKIESLEVSVSKQSLQERINKTSTDIAILREAKEELIKNANKLIEVVILIDKSGSVSGTEPEVTRGLNSFIKREQLKHRNEIVTTVLFNHKQETKHDRLPIYRVGDFYYRADGGTALYDTIINQINKTKEKQSKDLQKPKQTIVVITTDGEDQCSINHSGSVRRLVEAQRKEGWQFIFLGTNFDVLNEAVRLGIKADNAVEYNPLRLSDNFHAIEKALDDIYEKGEVTKDWSKPITSHKQLTSGDEKTYTKRLLGDK